MWEGPENITKKPKTESSLRGGVHPKFLGKLDLEIGVYQKAPPIGGTLGEVSESPRLSGSARRPRP